MIRFALVLIMCFALTATFAAGQDGAWRPDYDGIGRAVDRGDIQAVRNALRYNPLLVRAQDNTGWTILHLASRNNNREIVELLLEYDVDVNALSNNGQAPLHVAVEAGAKEIAGLLLSHEATVNVKDKHGATPLHYASKSGDKEMVELLIDGGADVSAKDSGGRTALDIARENKWTEVEKILSERAKK